MRNEKRTKKNSSESIIIHSQFDKIANKKKSRVCNASFGISHFADCFKACSTRWLRKSAFLLIFRSKKMLSHMNVVCMTFICLRFTSFLRENLSNVYLFCLFVCCFCNIFWQKWCTQCCAVCNVHCTVVVSYCVCCKCMPVKQKFISSMWCDFYVKWSTHIHYIIFYIHFIELKYDDDDDDDNGDKNKEWLNIHMEICSR